LIHSKLGPHVDRSDRARIEQELKGWREFFVNTEQNTLELLERLAELPPLD